jgi:eukaryotic-like serine/threonine-protein kinase
MSMWAVPGFAEERELGAGASGRVVAAVHLASGARVAIKYLSPRLVAAPGFLEAFRAEAALLRTLSVPQVVRIFDYAEAPGQGAAIIMERVSGISLHDMITRQGPASPEAALLVLKGSLLGLAAAHAVGIVHRDYKPENVLIDGSGASKLTDFGIAARAGQSASGGTPLYMAPEQWAGGPASPAGDIYAATAVFFECLTGRAPFAGPPARLAAQHESAPVPVERVDERLRPLVARGMAKDPAARPADAAQFLAELEATAADAYGAGWEPAGRAQLAAAALGLAAYSAAGAAAGAGSGTSTTVTWLSTARGAVGAHAFIYTGIAAAVIGIVAGSLAGISRATEHSPRAVPTTARPTTAGPSTPAPSGARPAAPSSAACGSSGLPALAYLTGPQQGAARSVVVRCGTGAPRTLASFQLTYYLPALAWSADGTRLGWTTGSAVYVATASSGTWTLRSWTCQQCASLAFQGSHAVSVSQQAVSNTVATQPELLVFPASGNAQPVTLPVTGIAAHVSTVFSVLATVSPADVIATYGTHYGAHGTGTELLYRVNPAGQATKYGTRALDQGTGPSDIYGQSLGDFAANAAGSTFEFDETRSGGAACTGTVAQVLQTATGTVATPATPPGGGGLGWEVQGMWFDQAGTPYVSLLPSTHGCAAPLPGAGNIVPGHAAPIVCKLSGGTWVPAGTGVFQAAYGPGTWLAEIAGTTGQNGGAPTTLTITGGASSGGASSGGASSGGATSGGASSGGAAPASATVPSVTAFAWAPR